MLTMYYYVILCSDNRTSHETQLGDRSRYPRSSNPRACTPARFSGIRSAPPRSSAVLSLGQYCIDQQPLVSLCCAGRAKRAGPRLDNKSACGRLPALIVRAYIHRHIPHGGSWFSVYMRIPLQTFLPKFKGLSVHCL